MLPRPLSRPHHLLGRLPSNGDLARTRTAASARSRSRLTRHGARDDTRYKSGDISRLQASTHAMACAPSCTRSCSGSALTLPSCSPPAPTTYARLQPHLPTAELQERRAARRGWSPLERIEGRMGSRPSRLPRYGCSRASRPRPPGRRRALVAPQWRWVMLAVSSRLGARPGLCVPATTNGCSAEHGTLTVTYTSGLAM